MFQVMVHQDDILRIMRKVGASRIDIIVCFVLISASSTAIYAELWGMLGLPL